MKKFFVSVALLLWAGILTAQSKERIKGNRQVVTKVYTLKPFHSIEFAEDLRVQLKQASGEESLELRADENLHEVLVWEVNEGVLRLYTKKDIVRKRAFEITIFVDKDLRSIKISETARIKSENKLKFNALNIEMDHYAKADLALIVSDTLRVNLKNKAVLETDAEAPVVLLKLTDDAEVKGMISGKKMKVQADKTADFTLGGSMKYVELNLTDKAEFSGKKFFVKKAATVRLDKRANASLKGQSAGMEMFLRGKSHLHLAGDFNRYELKEFKDNASITREP